MSSHWGPKEDSLLEALYPMASREEIIKKLGRPWRAVRRRAASLKITRDPKIIGKDKAKRGPRSDAWSVDEDRLLDRLYEKATKEEILSKIDRSWPAIRNRAYNRGLQRDPVMIKEERIEGARNAPPKEDSYTKEENEILKKIYENKEKTFILEKFPNRTWKGIREHAVSLGLSRAQYRKLDN